MTKNLASTLILVLLSTTLYAQHLTVDHVSDLFNTWMQSKGKSISATTSQLKKNSPSWALVSNKPTVEDYTKSYIWKLSAPKGNIQNLILDVEEDDESYKYGVSYVFSNKAVFEKMVLLLKQRHPSASVQSTNHSTNEYSLMVKGQITYFLFSENLKNGNNDSTIYRLEMTSKYIPK